MGVPPPAISRVASFIWRRPSTSESESHSSPDPVRVHPPSPLDLSLVRLLFFVPPIPSIPDNLLDHDLEAEEEAL